MTTYITAADRRVSTRREVLDDANLVYSDTPRQGRRFLREFPGWPPLQVRGADLRARDRYGNWRTVAQIVITAADYHAS